MGKEMEKLKEALKRIREWLTDIALGDPVPVPVPVDPSRRSPRQR